MGLGAIGLVLCMVAYGSMLLARPPLLPDPAIQWLCSVAVGMGFLGGLCALVEMCVGAGRARERAVIGFCVCAGSAAAGWWVAEIHYSRSIVSGFHELKSNGKDIYTAVFADAVDANFVGFPSTGQYSNATDYVLALATGESPVVPAGPDFFHFRKAGQRAAANWAEFGPEHCGWCFVADAGESTEMGYPFAFTANVRGNRVSDLKGRVGDTLDPKFPRAKCAVVVFHGGGSRILLPRESWDKVLADVRDQPDRPILRP